MLADTPFPFPWAQLVLTLLLAYTLTVPFLIVAYCNAPWLGLVLDFMCVQARAPCQAHPFWMYWVFFYSKRQIRRASLCHARSGGPF